MLSNKEGPVLQASPLTHFSSLAVHKWLLSEGT